MRSKIFFSLLVLSLFAFPLTSEIIEIHKIEEVLPYIDEDTLVVLDIDDTLMVPAQMLGGDCWFRHILKSLTNEGFLFEEALAKVLPEYMRFQHQTEVLPVEKTTAATVHRLQKKGFRVIGLTTRNTELAYRTVQQLKTLEIDLGSAPLFNKDLNVSTDFPLYYIEGILFTQLRHKGEALKGLCDRLGYEPKKVIFVNDKHKYVMQLEETFAALQIPYIGFRYAACDEDYGQYDPNISRIQRKYFNAIISDEDAAVILEAQRLGGDETYE